MKKLSFWKNILVFLTLIAPLMILGYYFLSPEWNQNVIPNIRNMWIASIGFFVYVIIILAFFIWLKVLSFRAINFYVPITLVVIVIFLTYSLPIWARFLIVLPFVFLAFPINILTSFLTNKYQKKNQENKNQLQENEKK